MGPASGKALEHSTHNPNIEGLTPDTGTGNASENGKKWGIGENGKKWGKCGKEINGQKWGKWGNGKNGKKWENAEMGKSGKWEIW